MILDGDGECGEGRRECEGGSEVNGLGRQTE